MNSKLQDNIYLDYAATTPVDPRVLEHMQPYFSEFFGNPSSIHKHGQKAEAVIESARESIASALNCSSQEIIFTSCGSESDNLALRGAALAARQERGANHILISPVEHHAISKTAHQLAALFDIELEYLPVNQYGQVSPQSVAEFLRPDTAIVSIIYANNEIGSLNPIAEIGAICRERGIPFHTDAVQGAAYLPIDVQNLNIDLMSIGAHKMYGPKGIGALYIKQGTSILPTQTGGGQEFFFRAGTSNVPYIAGQAKALSLANAERETNTQHYLRLRKQIISSVFETIPDVQLTGHPTERLPNHASFVFRGVDGNALIMMLDIEGFACSSGSACKTGNPEPSEVLTALNLDPKWGLGSLRVTVGKHTTQKEIGKFLETLPELVKRARTMETRNL